MNIVTSLNKKYIPYTLTMLISLGMNQKEHVDAYLLNSELDDADVELMNASLEEYDVLAHSLKVDRNLFDNRLYTDDFWTIETYYRLIMFDILDKDIDRVLYLDGDIIVNKSIEDFYHMDFEGKKIIACSDIKEFVEKNPKLHQKMFGYAYSCGFKYINAGVMLMNIAELRKKYSFQSYLSAMKEWEYKMDFGDQDIINYVHWKEIGYIDGFKYDLFATIAHNNGMSYEDVSANACIIHFAGEKPWNGRNYFFDLEKIWWEYAKHTPFYLELLEEFMHSVLESRLVDRIMTERDEYEQELQKLIDDQKKVIDGLIKRIGGIDKI